MTAFIFQRGPYLSLTRLLLVNLIFCIKLITGGNCGRCIAASQWNNALWEIMLLTAGAFVVNRKLCQQLRLKLRKRARTKYVRMQDLNLIDITTKFDIVEFVLEPNYHAKSQLPVFTREFLNGQIREIHRHVAFCLTSLLLL